MAPNTLRISARQAVETLKTQKELTDREITSFIKARSDYDPVDFLKVSMAMIHPSNIEDLMVQQYVKNFTATRNDGRIENDEFYKQIENVKKWKSNIWKALIITNVFVNSKEVPELPSPGFKPVKEAFRLDIINEPFDVKMGRMYHYCERTTNWRLIKHSDIIGNKRDFLKGLLWSSIDDSNELKNIYNNFFIITSADLSALQYISTNNETGKINQKILDSLQRVVRNGIELQQVREDWNNVK